MDTGDRVEELAEHLLDLVRDDLSDEMAFINSDRDADDFPLMIDDIVQFSGLSSYRLPEEARALIDEAVELIGPDDVSSQRIAHWLTKYHREG